MKPHLLLILAFVCGSASAAILTAVPRQGGMLMPEIWYHADTDSVTVDLTDATNVVAQLTPLLVSNPGDRFDPADPWYDDLDPSRRGLAFSRRYGFDMHVMTDYLPYDRELWIRCLAVTPGISFYDYNDYVTPKTWNPVFGTAGTSNAVAWDGTMWHFGVTALPGTNRYVATFEVFVMDTSAGIEVPGSSTGPFELPWTCVPDGRPEISISATASNCVALNWPASAAGWFLVSATNPNPASWETNPAALDSDGTNFTAVINHTAPQQFFRLQHLP